MQAIIPGQSNTLYADLVRTDCTPITTGSVLFYLVALAGANQGKWWDGATGTWSSAEIPAGTADHIADGHWRASISAAAWSCGVHYMLYAKAADGGHVPYSDQVVPGLAIGAVGTGDVRYEYSVTEADGSPVVGAVVYASLTTSIDDAVYRAVSDGNGVAAFYLKPGTWRFWPVKEGYDFGDLPDEEVIE